MGNQKLDFRLEVQPFFACWSPGQANRALKLSTTLSAPSLRATIIT